MALRIRHSCVPRFKLKQSWDRRPLSVSSARRSREDPITSMLTRLNNTSPSNPAPRRMEMNSRRSQTISDAPSNPYSVLESMTQPIEPSRSTAAETATNLKAKKRALEDSQVETFMSRRWRVGEIYTPQDIRWTAMRKYNQPAEPKFDVVDAFKINPLQEYKNFTMMSEFMTDAGRIKSSRVNGLRIKNQRRVAKAVRRAIGLGLMPSTHKHPEYLSHGYVSKNKSHLRYVS